MRMIPPPLPPSSSPFVPSSLRSFFVDGRREIIRFAVRDTLLRYTVIKRRDPPGDNQDIERERERERERGGGRERFDNFISRARADIQSGNSRVIAISDVKSIRPKSGARGNARQIYYYRRALS